MSYELSTYEEHALARGSSSKAMAYVGVLCNGKTYWGVGIHEDIIHASINALVVAVNKLPQLQDSSVEKDNRLIAMLNFIQANYQTVTLEDLAKEFHLSTPYISKFIREKSGKTFGEQVTQVRMKRAKTLLRNGNRVARAIQKDHDQIKRWDRLPFPSLLNKKKFVENDNMERY